MSYEFNDAPIPITTEHYNPMADSFGGSSLQDIRALNQGAENSDTVNSMLPTIKIADSSKIEQCLTPIIKLPPGPYEPTWPHIEVGKGARVGPGSVKKGKPGPGSS